MLSRMLVVSVVLLAAGSCARSEEPSGAEAADKPAQAAPAPSADGSSETVPMRLTDQGQARAERSVLGPADPRDTAFESPRFEAVAFLAKDFALGTVGTGNQSAARERAVLAAADSLFDALLSGELPASTLAPGMGPGGRAILEDLLWASGNLGPPRFGRVHAITEAEVSLQFRLLGDRRVAAGELILEKVEDKWYTADVQVEFSDRASTARFDPGTVRSAGSL